MEHECDAERVLFSYGFGTSVPTNSRRRLQQRYIWWPSLVDKLNSPTIINVMLCYVCDSVQLARRVLQLEKLNSSLRQQLSSEQSKASQLKQQVCHILYSWKFSHGEKKTLLHLFPTLIGKVFILQVYFCPMLTNDCREPLYCMGKFILHIWTEWTFFSGVNFQLCSIGKFLILILF